jgi:hypothetical protein
MCLYSFTTNREICEIYHDIVQKYKNTEVPYHSDKDRTPSQAPICIDSATTTVVLTASSPLLFSLGTLISLN